MMLILLIVCLLNTSPTATIQASAEVNSDIINTSSDESAICTD